MAIFRFRDKNHISRVDAVKALVIEVPQQIEGSHHIITDNMPANVIEFSIESVWPRCLIRVQGAHHIENLFRRGGSHKTV